MLCGKFVLDVLWSKEYFVGYAYVHIPVHHGNGIYNQSTGCISPSVVPTSVAYWENLNDCLILNTCYKRMDGIHLTWLILKHLLG